MTQTRVYLRRALNRAEEERCDALNGNLTALATYWENRCRRLSEQLDAIPTTGDRTHLDGWPLLPGEGLLGRIG
jgi:hypothetical protein